MMYVNVHAMLVNATLVNALPENPLALPATPLQEA